MDKEGTLPHNPQILRDYETVLEQDKHTDWQNRIKSPEISPYIYNQFALNKGVKQFDRKILSFQQTCVRCHVRLFATPTDNTEAQLDILTQKNQAGLSCSKGSVGWDEQALHIPRKSACGWLLGNDSKPLEYSARRICVWGFGPLQ